MAYGLQAHTSESDYSPDLLKSRCDVFYEQNVVATQAKIKYIEECSRLQAGSGVWHAERRLRLTASHFGRVYRRLSNSKLAPLVKLMLYSPFKGNANTRYGLAQESFTLLEYELEQSKQGMNIHVAKSGLVISSDHPFLAASLDGIVMMDGEAIGLVEVKNLLRTKLEEAARGKNFCLEMVNNQLRLKPNHDYYYQCQGQLLVCAMDWVDFVVRCTDTYQLSIERIHRDPRLQSEMVSKLSAFYFKHCCPN